MTNYIETVLLRHIDEAEEKQGPIKSTSKTFVNSI